MRNRNTPRFAVEGAGRMRRQDFAAEAHAFKTSRVRRGAG